MRRCAMWLLAFTVAGSAAGSVAGESTLKIALFDQRNAGGQGAAIEGLLEGLIRQGYQAEAITDLSMLTLVQYDILYLSDMHSPGRPHADWRQALKQFVRNGGSVLQTWHHHQLHEVGAGVKRIYNSRRMHVQSGHPAVANVSDFECYYKDHIIEKVGKAGTVLLTNDAGQPVAVAGMIGKGKVISTGLALAMPNGNVSRPPRGPERTLLKAFLAWLTPDVPREQRLDEVFQKPVLEVLPTQVQTPAGFDACFFARVAAPGKQSVQVTCDGAQIECTKALTSPSGKGQLSVFELTVPTKTETEQQLDLTVKAKVGDSVLEQAAQVTSIYAVPPKGEVRGVWLHVGKDRHPKVVMPELETAGSQHGRVAHCRRNGPRSLPPRSSPTSRTRRRRTVTGWQKLSNTRIANGIEIHPYVNNCVVEGRTSKESLEQLAQAGRLQQNQPEGRTVNWFCPSQEVNLAAMERVMVEIATRYDVDGVQYDFIRYPNTQGCFCPKCRALFERETGKPVADWAQGCG